MQENFAANLKRLRKARRLSQRELAEQIGLSKSLIAGYEADGYSRSAVAQYEMGRRKPSYEVLLMLSEFFHVSLDDLVWAPCESSIGQRIYAFRKEQGKTLEQIGEAVGVNKATVQRWESGGIDSPPADKLCALARALHTTPNELLDWR